MASLKEPKFEVTLPRLQNIKEKKGLILIYDVQDTKSNKPPNRWHLSNSSVPTIPGPPGPPGGVVVRDIGDTSVQLSWSRGFDNHSPIARYLVEARTLLSNKWKQMRTSKCPGAAAAAWPPLVGLRDASSPPSPCSVLALCPLALFAPLSCYWII